MTIINFAPVVDPIPGATILKGERYTASGTFADPGDDTWTADANYGDGSATVAQALGSRAFQLDHVYTTAGSFTVNVLVSDDDGGSGAAQAIVVVQTAQQGLNDIITITIPQLVASGVLTARQGTTLTALLRTVLTYINQQNKPRAVAALNSFITQVGSLVRAGRLPPAQGQVLTDLALRLIRVVNAI